MTQSLQRFVSTATADVFSVSPSPYLIVDRDFYIRAVNPAYERVTQQPAEALIGEYMFDAFPDNPATPEARATENLGRSFDAVLRSGASDRMPIQRYDVPAPSKDGSFVEKIWKPINSPLRNPDGEVAGVLHHVKDVTATANWTGLAESSAQESQREPVEELVTALADAREAAAELSGLNTSLQFALQSSREIGMALGIVMFSHKVTAEAAFEIVRDISRQSNRKVRDLALDIIERGSVDV